jgi:4-amino-4-deoxy-L-arabinose transferase-like glycosyltransferase
MLMADTEITFEIRRPLTWLLVGILLAVLVSEFLVSYYTPIAFGDEGYYIHIGRWMAQNKEYPALVPLFNTDIQQTGNFKAPLLMFIEGGLFMLFGFNEVIAKFLFPFIGFLTALAVYLLGKRLFSEKAAFFASIITVTASVFITYSVIFYVEVFSAFVFAVGGLLMIMHVSTKEKKYLILSAVFLAFGILTKIPNYASLAFIPLVAIYEVVSARKVTKDILKRYGLLFLIALGIVSTFFIRNYILFGVPSCEISFGMTNRCNPSFTYGAANALQGSASSGGTGSSLLSFGILQYLEFSLGPVWFVPLIFLCGLAALLVKREKNYILLMLLLLTVIPIIYKTLDSRVEETSRFTIGAIPIIGVIAGLYIDKITDFASKIHKHLGVVIMGLVIFVAFLNFGIPYVGSSLGYAGKLESLVPVKNFVPSFFSTCEWVRSNLPQDAVILSFYTTPTVYNCQRGSMWNTPDRPDILSGNLNLSVSRMKAEGYTHVFVQMFAVAPGFQDSTYPLAFVQMLDQNPNIFKNVFTLPSGDTVSSCVQKINSGSSCDGGIIYAINYTGVA